MEKIYTYQELTTIGEQNPEILMNLVEQDKLDIGQLLHCVEFLGDNTHILNEKTLETLRNYALKVLTEYKTSDLCLLEVCLVRVTDLFPVSHPMFEQIKTIVSIISTESSSEEIKQDAFYTLDDLFDKQIKN